jgi:hypothetical protein
LKFKKSKKLNCLALSNPLDDDDEDDEDDYDGDDDDDYDGDDDNDNDVYLKKIKTRGCHKI